MQRHLDEPRAAQRVLDEPQAAVRRKRVTGLRVVTRVEGNVVVRRVEARVVEEVKKIRPEIQVEALAELSSLLDGEVPTGLERATEEVAAGVAISGLDVVADHLSVDRGLAGGDAALPGLNQGNPKGVDIEHRFAGIYARGSLQLGALRSLAGDQRNQRIRDEIVRAVVEAGDGPRVVVDAVGLAAFQCGNTANAPAVDELLDHRTGASASRKLVQVADIKDVRTVEIRGPIGGPQVQRIVAIKKESEPAALVERMGPGVGTVDLQAVAQPLVGAELQRVVIRDPLRLVVNRVRAVANIGYTQVGVSAGWRVHAGAVLPWHTFGRDATAHAIDSVVAERVDLAVHRVLRCRDLRLIKRNGLDPVNTMIAHVGQRQDQVVDRLPLDVE